MAEYKIDNNILNRSYNNGVHLSMISDRVRVNSYIDAIEKNKIDFKDKVVADIGAGSGILSILAIKYGAKKVYAIEGNYNTIPLLKEMLSENGVYDKVKIINEISTNVKLPEKVDIIIHELIGTFAVNERGLGV